MEKKDKIAVIIQARMGSNRLPGKVLMPIGDSHVLQTLFNRLKPSSYKPAFILATTEKLEDDALEAWALQNGVNCHRGSELDVLSRFVTAIDEHTQDVDIVVRICSDNPLLSYPLLDAIIYEYLQTRPDYLSNSSLNQDYIEDGFVVEVFSKEALFRTHEEAVLQSDREHVCTYMKKHLNSAIITTCPGFKYKLSIDTPNDLTVVQVILENLGNSPETGIKEIKQFLDTNPHIAALNIQSKRNSGYLESLKADEVKKPIGK